MIELLKAVVEWTKTNSATNQLTAVLLLMLGGMAYAVYDENKARRVSADNAHQMVERVLEKRDVHEAADKAERKELYGELIASLKGVTQEQKKTTAAVPHWWPVFSRLS